MLRAEDNKFLTESGAGTPMGELLRRFWLPVLLSAELPEADGPPKKIVVMGEELLAFRDSRGVVGVIDQVLSAPRRQSLARPQRGMRHPLRLSRLEIRHRRRLRRHADLLSRSQRQGPDPHQVLSGARMGRHDLGLYGPGGRSAGIARAGNGAGAGLAPLRHQEMAGLQLGAGDGRLDRHRAFHLRASVLRQGRERNPRHQEALRQSADAGRDRPHALDRRRPAPGDQDHAARGRPHGRRRPAHRNRQHLLAHRPVPDAGACLCAELDAGREYFRPEFYPRHRHQLLDLHLCLESGAPADARPSATAMPTAMA